MKQIYLFLFCCLLSALLGFGIGRSFNKNNLNEKENAYARYNEKLVQSEQVYPQIKEQVLALEKNIYDLKRQATKDYIISEIQKENPQPQPQDIKVNNDDIKKFAADRNIKIEKLSDLAKKDLENNYKIHLSMLSQKIQNAKNFEELQIKWLIPIRHFEQTEASLKSNFPKFGGKNAKFTISLISNAHCPMCKEVENKKNALIEKFKENLSLQYFWILPADQPENSDAYQIALAAYCAQKQNQFLGFYTHLWQKPFPASFDTVKEWKLSAPLNTEKFDNCMQGKDTGNDLKKDLTTVLKLSSSGQPVFIINGFIVPATERIDFISDLIFSSL